MGRRCAEKVRVMAGPQSTKLQERTAPQGGVDPLSLQDIENRLITLLTDVARLRIRATPRVPSDEPASPPIDLPSDLIEIGIAAQLARRPADTVRSWCRTHLIDAGGFAMRLRGRWFVSRSRFLNFLRDNS
jgi:hypothetical protein